MLSPFVVPDYDFEEVILSILSLHLFLLMDVFNRCSLIRLRNVFNLFKEINSLRKEINGLSSEGISNINLNMSIEKD